MDDKTESIIDRGSLTCHCLLVENNAGLILIDTGLGLRDVKSPRSRLSPFFLKLLSPKFTEEMTAIRQIEKLGYNARDVRHIIMTHLDFDHAGGLDDFPDAAVHLLQDERDSAVAQKTWMDRQRYRPQQWSYRKNWNVYHAEEGDSWYGFKRVQALKGIGPEIAMIPLVGHTFGHAGVGVQVGNQWKLLAGDAYFFHAEMNMTNPWCTPGLRLYQFMLEKDRKSRLQNQVRLRELIGAHGNDVNVFCSHDVIEFERISGRPAQIPVEKSSIVEPRTA
jgi:glyoxylase-like metal-dependent hydrolase (beta-lactamase superfamily II)